MIRKTFILLVVAGVFIATAWQLSAITDKAKSGRLQSIYKNPLGIAVDEKGKTAFVALHTADAVAVVHLQAGKVVHTIDVGSGPSDVALKGNHLFVTCQIANTVVRVNIKTNKVTGRWLVDQSPRGLATIANAPNIFVACHDAQSLMVLDPATGAATRIRLPGQPVRVARHPQANIVYALSHRPGNAYVSEIETRVPFRVKKTHHLSGVTNARGLVILRYGNGVMMVAHQKPRANVPATQVAQGWVFTNAVSLHSMKKGALARKDGVLDEPNRGFADPSDVVWSLDNDLAYVACAGADTVLVVRVLDLYHSRGDWAEDYEEKDDLTRSRQFVIAKIPTGTNPRRLALSGDGRILVASNTLGDSLTVIDAKKLTVLKTITLGSRQPDSRRRGEIAFHSNTMTFQGQFTCASCHPNGGGSDGLNWDLTRDGVGSFMNTRSLLGSRDTAPYGWLGTSPTYPDRITGTLRTLHRHEPEGTEVADLTAYLKSLAPPKPLTPFKGDAKSEIEKGRTLFAKKGGCATCHRGETLQDGLTHNIGSKFDGDLHARFDTPSLRGVARTAPYLHHGKAMTLNEVFTRFNRQKRHGRAHELTKEELDQLLAYLRSL